MSVLTKFITPESLAKTWEMGRTSIYDLLKRKNNPLPGFKIGASWRIDPVAAAKWLDEEQGRRLS